MSVQWWRLVLSSGRPAQPLNNAVLLISKIWTRLVVTSAWGWQWGLIFTRLHMRTYLRPVGTLESIDAQRWPCQGSNFHVGSSLHQYQHRSSQQASLFSFQCILTQVNLIRLSVLPRKENVLPILLHPSQPPWLIVRSARLLVLLTSCASFSGWSLPINSNLSLDPSLCRALLSLSMAAPEELPKTLRKSPLMERLCSYVVDGARHGPEVRL